MSEYVSKMQAISNPAHLSLKSKGYLTLGKWQQQLQMDCSSNEHKRTVILQNLQLATQFDPGSHEAWHAWALFNQKIAERLQKKKKPSRGAAAAPPREPPSPVALRAG